MWASFRWTVRPDISPLDTYSIVNRNLNVSNTAVYLNMSLFMQALSESFPWVKPLYDGCDANRVHWERLAEQVDMGLTWIDHETIEKPVERDNAEGNSHT